MLIYYHSLSVQKLSFFFSEGFFSLKSFPLPLLPTINSEEKGQKETLDEYNVVLKSNYDSYYTLQNSNKYSCYRTIK